MRQPRRSADRSVTAADGGRPAVRPTRRRGASAPSVSATGGAGVGGGVDDEESVDVETISTLEQLDEKLQEVEAARLVSDDKMREVFVGFQMAPPTDLPDDPYSPEYVERQFELYRRIAGRSSYEVDSEESNFPTDLKRPFPYYTESPETVGQHLIAMGRIIRTMALPAGSSILELGAGWGNTTIAMAQMGYDVMAIDIDPNFVRLIADQAARLSLSVDVRRGQYLDIDQLERTFDAVLFFESFHHCSDHLTLLDHLRRVLAPGGGVFFAAEPIHEFFPVPWGVRLDGESLWAIRQKGWLELGFQESYFIRTLLQLGWTVRKHVSQETYLGLIYEGRRANGRYDLGALDMPPDEDETWAEPDWPDGAGHRFASDRSEITLERSQAYESVVLDAINPSPLELPFSVQHGRNRIEGIAASGAALDLHVPYDPEAAQLVIECETWCPADLLGSLDEREIGIGVRSITLRGSEGKRLG
jgi:2-polyprenyl-3-methyl-5-hydroxy-6-metoxy-1,4-benzoquinol methylase